jgi:O-antigen ligase
MVLLAAALLYSRRRRAQLEATGALAVLWAGLVLTLSRSSLAALLVGLGILGAMRWRARPILAVAVAVAVAGVVAVVVSPNTFGLNQGRNGASSGRAGLVGGGLRLFGQRPGWGYGSGSFSKEYLCRIKHQCGSPSSSQSLSASHTIPVTVAAEQGLIGEVIYVALVIAAGIALVRGARVDPPRAAIAATFLALVFHTFLYADFLEDPETWVLLGIGTALAFASRAGPSPHTVSSTNEVPSTAATAPGTVA